MAAGLEHGMGTVRVLGAGDDSMRAEPVPADVPATAPEDVAKAMTAMPEMPGVQTAPDACVSDMTMERAGGTQLEVAAVALLTLVALGGGIFIAERSGGFDRQNLEMPHDMTGM